MYYGHERMFADSGTCACTCDGNVVNLYLQVLAGNGKVDVVHAVVANCDAIVGR